MLAELNRRARYILASQGIVSLFKRISSYFLGYIFRFNVYGIKRHFPQLAGRLDPSNFLPHVIDHDFFAVKDNKEAGDLEKRGFEFRSRVFRAKEALDHGGVALIVFIDHEIASINWIATNSRLQKIFDDPPHKVDYSAGEAIICGAATFPKFRQKGLYTYNLFKAFEYLASTGNEKCISFTAKNLPIYGISERLFGSKLIGYGYWLRILGINFYWEKRV